MHKDQQGFSIPEVLIALAAVSLMIVGIGKIMYSVKNMDKASENKVLAAAYAQQSMELMGAHYKDFFNCNCADDACSGGTCFRADTQNCALLPTYTSCWTEYPDSNIGKTNFKLEKVGTVWKLTDLGGADEAIATTTDTLFKRKINITNAQRDTNMNIASGTPDYNTKIVTVTVSWAQGAVSKSVEIKKIFTAWKKL